MFPILKKDPLLKIISSSLVYLPCPSNMTYMWNFGSLLGLTLGVQLVTGIFLAMYYVSDPVYAFNSVDHIMRDVNYGWEIRIIHSNGASMFFCLLYLHMGRGLYYNSYMSMHSTWLSGVTLLLLVMATAFLGYVLPWGQMSFWGATVITNLFSAIPWLGTDIVTWLWGGYSVASPTLTRFFSLHFLMPFVITGMVMIHLLFLHQTGSNNFLGTNSNYAKLMFHPYFSFKDLYGMAFTMTIFMFIIYLESWTLGDPENFIPANPLVTPVHIQPEWYFLFAYAILRSIPNKLGGVVALAMSVMIFYFMPLFGMNLPIQSSQFMLFYKIMFWTFCNIVILLTWIGACPVESPYVMIGQILTVSYFLIFFGITIYSIWLAKYLKV